jgi:hypothetical protein
LHDNLVPRVFAPRGKTLSTRLLAWGQNFVRLKKMSVILPCRNYHIYWPMFLMQITTPSSPAWYTLPDTRCSSLLSIHNKQINEEHLP